MSLQSLIFNSAPFAVVPAMMMAMLLFRSSNITLRILSIHILISAITEFSSTLLWSMKINNIFLLHIYTLEEFALLSWFYATIITGKAWKTFFQASVIVFSILTLLNSIFLQTLSVNNTYARGLESLICMVYAIICFNRLINSSSSSMSRHYYLGLLLINSGVLIYFTSSSLLFTLSNYLRKPELTDARMLVWTFHAFFSIVYYLLLFFGLWIIRRSKSYSYYLQAH